MSLAVKTGLSYVRRSPFQAIAAIFVLALTFFISTLLAVLVYSSGKLVSYFETRPQIIAFLKDESTPETISALQRKLESDPRVKNVNYVTKEQALEIYKKATSDNPLLAELVSPSIFPASLEFSVTDLSLAKDLIDEVKSEAIVDSVGFTASIGGKEAVGDVVERLKTIAFYIKTGGIVLVSALGFTSFMVLTVVIGMRMVARKGEVEVLRLIGAKPGFIRGPIMVEAVVYALIGVATGWVFAVILILYSTPAIISYFGDIPVLPRDSLTFFGFLGAILVGEAIMGVIISTLGSSVAISRAMKQK